MLPSTPNSTVPTSYPRQQQNDTLFAHKKVSTPLRALSEGGQDTEMPQLRVVHN